MNFKDIMKEAIDDQDMMAWYDPQLMGFEEMDKLAAEKGSKNTGFWKDLWQKIKNKSVVKDNDPPEGSIAPIWNQFLPKQEADEE